ncbi:MAG: cell wall hydrolase [Candidatus Accumulibacter delftensis]|jgi:N-acetylmuramoyl-L-alanine amidase
MSRQNKQLSVVMGLARRRERLRDCHHRDGIAQSGPLDVIPHGKAEGGTTAALCEGRLGSKRFLLTCGHTFLDVPFTLRAQIDLCAGGTNLPSCGRVGQCSPDAPGKTAAVDAALVEVAPETARWLATEYPELTPRGASSAGLLCDQSLTVHSRRGRISGRLISKQCNFHVESNAGNYWLRSVYLYRAAEPTEPGDSGAAVWDDQGRLVGVHCGALAHSPDSNAFFCDIDAIVDAFGIRIITRERAIEPGELAPPLIAELSTKEEATAQEIDVVARTIWGEAGELGNEAMRAVAAVIVKRQSVGKWWGRSASEVCLRPYQFRCWDVSSPSIFQVRSVSADIETFRQALSIAEMALDPERGISPDRSLGATRYHPQWVVPVPDWARGLEPCATVGGLCFYNNID